MANAMSAFILPIRIVQGVLAIIILGLMAYASNRWSWFWSPSSINFLIFTSIWTLLAVAYLVVAPMRFPAAAHKFGILAAEFITMIFWFAGFVAVASLLEDIDCGRSDWGPCKASIAGDVFAAFEWLLFVATTILAVLHVLNTRNSSSTKHDPTIEVHGGAHQPYPAV